MTERSEGIGRRSGAGRAAGIFGNALDEHSQDSFRLCPPLGFCAGQRGTHERPQWVDGQSTGELQSNEADTLASARRQPASFDSKRAAALVHGRGRWALATGRLARRFCGAQRRVPRRDVRHELRHRVTTPKLTPKSKPAELRAAKGRIGF
jgi:hypothetical protein